MKCTCICVILFSMMLLLSCKQEAEKTPETTETKVIQKETVIVKDTVKPDGTSIKINNDGIAIDSKDVKVEVKK